MSSARIHCLLAEFDSAVQLVAALSRVRATVPTAVVEVYSPFPIEAVNAALPPHRDHIPMLMLLGAIVGGVGTFLIECYSAIVDYPINVGGRPTASWPAFVPAAIEMALLFAAVFGVITMLVSNGLPQLHHPLFASKAFERATADRFFLLLRLDDDVLDIHGGRELLTTLSPLAISEVTA